MKNQVNSPIAEANASTPIPNLLETTDLDNGRISNKKVSLDLGENSPLQPNFDFPKRDGRKFNTEWYSLFKWVENSVDSNAAFYFACRKFQPPDASKAEAAFRTEGFTNWTKAMESERGFRKHESGDAHHRAMEN